MSAAAALRAGAAEVDTTPEELVGLNAMGEDFVGVHDSLAARALVLEAGGVEIALLSIDLLEVGATQQLRSRIEAATGIAADRVLIAPTHSHNAPRAGQTPPGGLSRPASAESLAYTEILFAKLVQLVADAQARLTPARVGIGRGAVDVNCNRDELMPDGTWGLGVNPDGHSDKTVTVISVQGASGETIATVVGYAVHPIAALGTRELSADIAGAAISAVADQLGGVALWLAGALGDQDARVNYRTLTRDGVAPRSETVFAAVAEQGGAIAAEAVRVAHEIDDWATDAAVDGTVSVVTCPAKRGSNQLADMRQAAVDTVDLRLSVLRIGDIALLGLGGEVTTDGAAQILAASPVAHPVLVSMANERLGYLGDDLAFERGSFTARGCPVTQGWLPRAAEALAELVDPAEQTT